MRARTVLGRRRRTALAASIAALLATAVWQSAGATIATAARDADIAEVRKLIAAGSDVNAREADGTSALLWAAHQASPELVSLLLEAGADPNAANNFGVTPLLEASRYGDAATIKALLDGGADVIWIETMSDLEEVRAAVEGTRRASATIPIVTTMSFDTHGHTMFGVSPAKAATTLAGWGVAALGANCGNGPDELLAALEKMRAAVPDALLVAKTNAGMPRLAGGKAVYDATPEEMAGFGVRAARAGARIIGGCCGSSPAHLRAISPAETRKS